MNHFINLYNSTMNVAKSVADGKKLDEQELRICYDVIGFLLSTIKGTSHQGMYTYDDIKNLINS